jgi:thiosulfate dehydrogenase
MRVSAKVGGAAFLLMATAGVAVAQSRPKHEVPASPNGDVVVGLCDGHTAVEVPGLKPGQTMPRSQAQAVSDELMAQWRQKNPRSGWAEEERLAQNTPTAPPPPGQPASVQASGGTPAPAPLPVQEGHNYGGYTQRDEALWRASTDAFVDQGNKTFHDAQLLGGTIGVSCDMCHPNAANTHPETYPKFQVQLGRVALLRDMINWCIENPVRGKPLADDDPKMKAMEAYILAQRKGTALAYGKH